MWEAERQGLSGLALGLGLLLSSAAACKPPDLSPFLGAWQLSGSASISIGSGASLQTMGRSSTSPLPDYQIAFARSEDAELVSTDSLGCRLLWAVSGSTARTEPRQSCTATSHSHPANLLEITAGSIALERADATHLSASGDLMGTVSRGGALMGTVESATAHLAGRLTRIEGRPGDSPRR